MSNDKRGHKNFIHIKDELGRKLKGLRCGAGTGSVSIQAATICKKGRVFAIEKDEEALDIIKKIKRNLIVEI